MRRRGEDCMLAQIRLVGPHINGARCTICTAMVQWCNSAVMVRHEVMHLMVQRAVMVLLGNVLHVAQWCSGATVQ